MTATPNTRVARRGQGSPVNREDQVKLIERAIKAIQISGPIFQTVYEFTGIPGIGKSTLIAMLHGLAKSLSVPVAHLDFDPDLNPHIHSHAQDPVLLLQVLAEQLFPEPVPILRDAIAGYNEIPPSETYRQDLALDEVLGTFRIQVEELSEQAPSLFLFDSTDQAPPDVLTWLEKRLVSPLSQKGRYLFVFAGRSPLHWNRFEVRRRVHSERLGVLEGHFIKDLLTRDRDHPGLSGLAEQVYDLTAGYPLGSLVVQRRLGEMLDQGEEIDHQTFPIYEPGLLDDLVHKAIDEYVFRDVDQELVNACRVLALLRQFDVILLRRVLSRFVPDFKDYPRAAYGGLLGLLHATQVIEWDDGRKGYNVAMPLRQILSQHMRQHNPRQYIAINQAALEVYHDWIKRVSENRSVYIIEAVYHQAVINRVSAPQATEPADIVQQFRAYLERCYTLENYADDRDLLDGALNRLEQELKRDDELTSLLEGLEIPVETLHQIIADHHKH